MSFSFRNSMQERNLVQISSVKEWFFSVEISRFFWFTVTFFSTVWKSAIKRDHDFYGKINIFSVKSTFLLNKEVAKELISRKMFECDFVYGRRLIWRNIFVDKSCESISFRYFYIVGCLTLISKKVKIWLIRILGAVMNCLTISIQSQNRCKIELGRF